jgi:hypothetical protein
MAFLIDHKARTLSSTSLGLHADRHNPGIGSFIQGDEGILYRYEVWNRRQVDDRL